MFPTFEHCYICEHALRTGRYMVINTTFPAVPPFVGTLKQCIKAAAAADRSSAELLTKIGR